MVLMLGLTLVACAPSPEPAPPPTYTVARGDSLSRIAKTYGTTAQQLRDWNGIEGDLIVPGQVLIVGSPGGGAGAVAAKAPAKRSSARRAKPSAARGATPPGVLGFAPDEGPSYPPLSMPPAKPCLAEDVGIGDAGFGRSVGLEAEQVSAGVAAFQTQTLRCYGPDTTAAGEVQLALVIGCDGRVRSSSVRDDGTGDPAFAACVADAFRYAGFDAHARDEVEVVVPLRYTAP